VWPESIVADVVFGWRQLLKHKTASAAAILSLALGIGASMAAFRLIDALFLRPLPVAHPEQLYELTYPTLFEGRVFDIDRFDFPDFRSLSNAVEGQAHLMAISIPLRVDVTIGADLDIERVWRQYVPGTMFSEFGLKPALGRLLSSSDDITPRAAPYAVISYDYWSRRFARSPSVIGQHFRTGTDIFEIIGVAPQGFTGTDPGTFTDIFVPNAMNVSAINGVYRAWFRGKLGVNLDQLRGRLSAAMHSHREEEVKTWSSLRPKQDRDFFVAAPVSLSPVGNGRSGTQHGYERALTIPPHCCGPNSYSHRSAITGSTREARRAGR
jgi:putative ABC transport system permease protein